MNYMMLKLGDEFTLLQLNHIDWIQSEGKYLRIYSGNKSFLKKQSLNNIESRLDPDKFVRVNRQAIVNIEKIRKIKRDKDSQYQILLSNNLTFLWGKTYRRRLIEKLKRHG